MWTKLKQLFKRKRDKQLRNCHHEDFAHLVEPAFIGAGVNSPNTQYYRFKGSTELDMTAGRYNKASKFFVELNMRMSAEDLTFYVDKIEEALSKETISIMEIAKWVGIIKDRTRLLLEEKTVLKLASATYFDESEVLDSYDYEYNIKKMNAWQEAGNYDFFFIKPISDLLPLPESWKQDSGKMSDYMSLANEVITSHLNIESDTVK